jgi:spermidine dehydrogenase
VDAYREHSHAYHKRHREHNPERPWIDVKDVVERQEDGDQDARVSESFTDHLRCRSAFVHATLSSKRKANIVSNTIGSKPPHTTQDRALGMDARISRRDFLNASLLASGGALLTGAAPHALFAAHAQPTSATPATSSTSTAPALSRAAFDGYGGIGDYAHANGNTFDVIAEGHKIRDHVYDRIPPRDIHDAGTFDCVVVGGGISGLASALFFQREAGAGRTCLVLEDHAIFGGLARANEFLVDGQRVIGNQASAMFFPPLPDTFFAEFYPSIGIDLGPFTYQTWTGRDPEIPIGRTPYFDGGRTSAFYFGPRFGQPAGVLVTDPWGTRLTGAPITEQVRAELLRMADTTGVRERSTPKQHGDALSRRLDRITLEQHLMEEYGISRETVRTFLSPVSGGGSGIGADALSAYADYAADTLLPWDYAKGPQMFPGGNAGVARHIVKVLIPDAFPGANTRENVAHASVRTQTLDRAGQPTRIRTGCTVISVQHDGPPDSASRVAIIYSDKGKLYRVHARAVIMAGGSWTSKYVVTDLPATHRDAYAQFHRSPCLLANVAVRQWRFLYDHGLHECRWFEGIGNYLAVRRTASFGPVPPTISPDSPVVLTLKILFSYPDEPLPAQVSRGRAELLSTPFRDYERRIREQLTAMFGRFGFDARRDIAGIILNRWGHAYLSAQPGFFFGGEGKPAPGEVLRNQPVGRIAFANSDLTGIMDHRTSILEAKRAVTQVVPRLA